MLVGPSPTNFEARQSGAGTILVSWSAVSPAPENGYRITVNSTDISSGLQAMASPFTISTTQSGVHILRLVPVSQHLLYDFVGPIEVIVIGKHTIILP